MYRSDFEAMPRKLKEELVECTTDFKSADAIIPAEDEFIESSLDDIFAYNVIQTLKNSSYFDDFPDFWIVTSTTKGANFVYLCFDVLLNEDQERRLQSIDEFFESSFCGGSYSDIFSIY